MRIAELIAIVILLGLPNIAFHLELRQICGCPSPSEYSVNCTNLGVDFACLADRIVIALQLTGNNYSDVPEELLSGRFIWLQQLDMSHNQIGRLPDGITESLPNLIELNLRSNNFSYPNELLKLASKVKVNVLENPFDCDCNNPKLPELLQRTNDKRYNIACYDRDKKNYIPYVSTCYNRNSLDYSTPIELKKFSTIILYIIIVGGVCVLLLFGKTYFKQ